MGTFRITVEIGGQSGQRFQELEALVDTGATFTKVPRSILEALDIPAVRTYTALLADGRRVPIEQGWAIIRLEGQQFPTPVAFGEEGEPTLLGAMALEHALLAVGPARTKAHARGCPGDDQHGRMNGGSSSTR